MRSGQVPGDGIQVARAVNQTNQARDFIQLAVSSLGKS
jgi:hypothetical protein